MNNLATQASAVQLLEEYRRTKDPTVALRLQREIAKLSVADRDAFTTYLKENKNKALGGKMGDDFGANQNTAVAPAPADEITKVEKRLKEIEGYKFMPPSIKEEKAKLTARLTELKALDHQLANEAKTDVVSRQSSVVGTPGSPAPGAVPPPLPQKDSGFGTQDSVKTENGAEEKAEKGSGFQIPGSGIDDKDPHQHATLPPVKPAELVEPDDLIKPEPPVKPAKPKDDFWSDSKSDSVAADSWSKPAATPKPWDDLPDVDINTEYEPKKDSGLGARDSVEAVKIEEKKEDEKEVGPRIQDPGSRKEDEIQIEWPKGVKHNTAPLSEVDSVKKINNLIKAMRKAVDDNSDHADADYLKEVIGEFENTVADLETRADKVKMSAGRKSRAIGGRVVHYLGDIRAEFEFSDLFTPELVKQFEALSS